jgi:acetylglutamate synthase
MGNKCELCEREVEELTGHHLIPRTRHTNKKNQKLFDRTEVKERKAMVCESCHSKIHATISEKELELFYNTTELLKDHPEIKKFVKWIKNKPGSMVIKSKERK